MEKKRWFGLRLQTDEICLGRESWQHLAVMAAEAGCWETTSHPQAHSRESKLEVRWGYSTLQKLWCMSVSLQESDFKGLMRLTINILKAPLNSLNGPQLKMTVLEVNICSFLAFMTNQTFQISYNFSTFATWKRVAFWQWLSNISWASSYLFFLQRWFLLLKCFPEAMLMLWNSWCILFFKNWNAAIPSPPIFRLLYYREELHLVSWDTLGLTLSLVTTSKLSNLPPSITPYTWSTFYSNWNCFLLPSLSVFTRVFLTPT